MQEGLIDEKHHGLGGARRTAQNDRQPEDLRMTGEINVMAGVAA
jgi:hypothetical protein